MYFRLLQYSQRESTCPSWINASVSKTDTKHAESWKRLWTWQIHQDKMPPERSLGSQPVSSPFSVTIQLWQELFIQISISRNPRHQDILKLLYSQHIFLRSHLWKESKLFKSCTNWLHIDPAILAIILAPAGSILPSSQNQYWLDRKLPSSDFWRWWWCWRESVALYQSPLVGTTKLIVRALGYSVPHHIGTLPGWPFVLVHNVFSHSHVGLWGQASASFLSAFYFFPYLPYPLS